MADVACLPGVFEQIRLIAGIRFRILRNNLKNKNRGWDLVGLIFASVGAAFLVVSCAIGIYVGTIAFLESHHEGRLAFLFWGIFLWWQALPVFVAGFSPSFPFRTMLRFPWKLSTFYLIGLAYGLADSAAIASILWLLTMLAAVAVTRFSLLPITLFTVALFVAVNVTLERLTGSWLEKLLARRRSREVFIALFAMSLIGLQFIAPALQRYGGSARPIAENIIRMAKPFPGSLAGDVIGGVASGEFGTAALGAAGLAAYALLFGGLLLSRFRAQYLGEELNETMAPKRALAKPRATADVENDIELRILPPTIAAVVRKELRYLLRNGFYSVSLLFPPALVLIFASQFGSSHTWTAKTHVPPDLFFPAMMGYLTLIMLASAFNNFAYEGRGMQTFFMVPVRFRDILMAKNTVTALVLFSEMTVCTVIVKIQVGLPSLPVFLATMMALVFVLVGQLAIANWSSLMFPKKMDFGKMQGNRQSGMAVLIAFAAQIIFGTTCGFVLFAGRVMGNPWLSLEIFAFLAAAAVGGYIASLDPLSALAERKKESLLETLMK